MSIDHHPPCVVRNTLIPSGRGTGLGTDELNSLDSEIASQFTNIASLFQQ